MIFEKATRHKLRFQYKGSQTVEDLWDLKLEDLDHIYSGLRAEQRASETDSLLKKTSKEGIILALKIDIIKHIVDVKQSEAEIRVKRAETREQARRIREIIAQKKDEALAGMSLEDLEKRAGELDDDGGE